MAAIRQPDPVRVVLNYNGTEHICKQMPIGWRDQSGSWSFSFDNFGYNYKHETKELQFVKEDADFIRQCIDQSGISANIEFTVQLRQNNWTFKDNFHGKLDFTTEFINERDFVQCGVLEGGVKKSVTKDGKTNYDMPFDNDAVDIHVTEGMIIKNNVKYENISSYGMTDITNGDIHLSLGGDIVKSDLYKSHVIFMNKSEVNRTPQFSDAWVYTVIRTTENDNAEPLTFTLKMKLNVTVFAGPFQHLNQVSFRLIKYDKNYANPQIVKEFYFVDGLDISDEIYEFNVGFDGEIDIQIENKINNYCFIADFLAQGVIVNKRTSSIRGDLTFDFDGDRLSTFNFKAYKSETFGQKLLDKIHSGATFEVPFLQEMEQNKNMQLFITSADAIRGIKPTDEQPQGALIKTNFFEFLKNLNYIYSTGQKVNNTESKYDIVRKPDIFDRNNEILNLGKVKNLQAIMPELDWFKNNVQVGYEKQEYDYPLGRQEFANTLEFNNDIDIPAQTLELISKYRADYTGVHLLYFDYVNDDKKDSKSDNDVFWILAFRKTFTGTRDIIQDVTQLPARVTGIYVNTGQQVEVGQTLFKVSWGDSGLIFDYYVYSKYKGQITTINVTLNQIVPKGTLLGTINATITQWQATKGDRVTNIQGLEGGGYFNMLLSPKAMLMNHARFFASLLDKHAKILRYTSSTETMSALEYTDTELGHVVEKADLSVANAEPFFKPVLFKFDCIVRKSLPQILGDSPSGYFTFRYNNLELKGFPIDIQGSLEDSKQTVTCIAHPDTPDNIEEILHKRLPNKLYK
ncbi:MAG: hypothetical protein LBK94_04880 [Prevotellaceae bacterium]|jgi:hypothetical protein|nr:hypothetical protein [Prevotellaceae bacterium]